MICALDLCDTDVVLHQTYETLQPPLVQCTLEDTYEAMVKLGDGTPNDLDALLGGSYAVMGTGNVEGDHLSWWCDDAGHPSGYWFDPFAPDEPWHGHDIFEWRIQLSAPAEAEAFRFRYVFFSVEYDEYISSGFNDKFYVILQAPSTSSGQPTVINFTECRDPFYYDFICPSDDYGCQVGERYCYLTVNSALSECCWFPANSDYVDNSDTLDACPGGFAQTDISGTGFECAYNKWEDSEHSGSSTGWLQTSWPIQAGETFTLTFHIHDTSDGIYDSLVILDSFQFLTGFEQGTIVVE
jgi:hypothetical protein